MVCCPSLSWSDSKRLSSWPSLYSTEWVGATVYVAADDRLFACISWIHREQARDCWKQSRLPSPGLWKNEIAGIIAAQERFWPGHEEYRDRLLAFLLSEGGGRPDGNPRDPSYGVAHITLEAARFSARFWGITIPRGKDDLIERLGNDSKFCILLAAGELAAAESRCGGDWLLATGHVKHGPKGFERVMNATPDRPVTDIPAVSHYVRLLGYVQCLRERITTGTMVACGCSLR